MPRLPSIASLLVVATFACDRSASKDQASTPVTAPVTASAKTADAACAPLAWDDTGDTATATSFKGKVATGEGTNGRAETEKFQTLVLDKPACGPDKAPVAEVQLYTNDAKIDLKKTVGKTVTVEGEPFSAHTAHHHRPIVVEVKKLTAN